MQSRSPRVAPHPLPWVEGISLSVVLACVVSIGLLMGWIPISIDNAGDNTVAASPVAPESPIAAVAPVAPGWEGDGVAMSARCDDCGALIVPIRVIARPRASLPSPIGGATGEAVTGNGIEKRVSSNNSYGTTVRFDHASTRVPGETTPPE